MAIRVLLLGSGGREHAWALALKRSNIELINWSPIINPGIAELSEKIIEEDFEIEPDIASLGISLAVIGPEAPLVNGVTDWLESIGISVFGPNKMNARLEGSKSYTRQLMSKYQVDGNIDYHICRTSEEIDNALDINHVVAVKPDGLTGGKGVFVFGDHLKDKGEVVEYANNILQRDGIVVLEELLDGSEFTLQAFVNGAQIVFLPLVQDYKRAYDNDIGPNTGSMGSVSYPDHRLPLLSDQDIEQAKQILAHVARSASMENGPYRGALYGQFMLTTQGPKLVEFNVRLGDPEAINALALLEQPVFEILTQLLDDEQSPEVTFSKDATCCVYLVPEGYPSEPESGIQFKLEKEGSEMIRYGSVIKEGNMFITTRARSIAIISKEATIDKARNAAYANIPKINGLRYRSDIGLV